MKIAPADLDLAQNVAACDAQLPLDFAQPAPRLNA